MRDVKAVSGAVLELKPDAAFHRRPFDDKFIPVICGSMLCRLRVWTEEEWADLADAERPTSFRVCTWSGLGRC